MKKSTKKKTAAVKKGVKKSATPKRRTATTAQRRNGAQPTFPKHVHPYGTNRHPNLDWHSERFVEAIAQMDEKGRAAVEKAMEFSRERHSGQKRIGGGEYVIHPVRIANILMSEWSQSDPNVVAAALLHDVVEDTQTTLKEIKDAFGNDIGRLVDGMTMWKGSETYETYIKRVSRGPEQLRIIKCADVLDNLRSWYETNGDEFPRWWRNANEFVLPMARSVEDDGVALNAIHKVLNDPWYLKKAGME